MTSEEIQYKVVVTTGQSGLDANVILCIFGDEETTPNLALRQTSAGVDARFEPESNLEFHLKAVDVGKIKKINIGHDGKGEEQQWFLKSITIEKKGEHYEFEAQRWLSEVKDDHKTYIDLLPVEPAPPTPRKKQATYRITVVTSSDDHAGTDCGVLMSIFGDQDSTKQFPLLTTKQGEQASFETGKTNEFQMELDDVGQITKINIGHDGKGQHPKWHLQLVEIEKDSQTHKFFANRTLDQANAFADLTPGTTPTVTPRKEKTPTPAPASTNPSRRSTPDSKKKRPENEITYKVSIQIGASQQRSIDPDTPFYLIMHGENGQEKKVYLRDGLVGDRKHAYKKDEKTEFEFKGEQMGKIGKITLGQEGSEHGLAWHVDHVIIKHGNETTTFNVEQTVRENEHIDFKPSPIPKHDTPYHLLVKTGAQQEDTEQSHLVVTIYGSSGQTKAIPLNELHKKTAIKKDQTLEFHVKGKDVGKITKLVLTQDGKEQNIDWHIDHITIKRGVSGTTFYADRKLERQGQVELVPTPIPTKSETPRRRSQVSKTEMKPIDKTKDADYEITVMTGDEGLDGKVLLHIRGSNGTVIVPLNKTTSGNAPFQAKSTDQFTSRTTDVGRIRRITVEHDNKARDKLWHLKGIQVKKGTESYNFRADHRLDDKTNQVNLYPVGAFYGHQKEDYVQTELRRLRESLRVESSKIRAPPLRDHVPFLFNDLSPYLDTSPVERAIYAPLDTPPGYYTRVTALRIVEPWEAYGMDFGVNYEILKQRRGRSISGKRPTTKSADESIDRKQGSTHLPKFPCVELKKPREYTRVLTMNDVPKIRTLIRDRYTAQAHDQIKKDYQRTREDFYRMQLDNLESYHPINRDNMVGVYHSYLENTPGSKKALRELCENMSPRAATSKSAA